MQRKYIVAVADRRPLEKTKKAHTLGFKKITMEDLPVIEEILRGSTSRTCDYTVGGLFMWIRYFDYEFAVAGDTLFIKGELENHPGVTGYSLPVGPMPIADAIELLRTYCIERGETLRFSAIPEDRLADFRSVGLSDTEEMTDWADYLYDAQALATLSGKKLSKKRNHVNRFTADNPGYRTEPLELTNREQLRESYASWMRPEDVELPSAREEHQQVFDVIDNLELYPFEGMTLYDGQGRIVAFTIGEVIADTLYVHIEKINKDVAGAGEAINKFFAEAMLEKYPGLRYINREEDTGDEGLRRAKQSYHPAMMLRKYNISL